MNNRAAGVALSATLNEAFNSAASQMREAAEMMVDFGAGAIDGAIDTVTLGFDVVPDIGPVYGHQGAYLAGNVTGSVATGVGIGMISGGAGGFLACTSRLRTAAQLYTALDTGVGVARAGHNIATTGKVGLGDALALAPGAGFGVGKLGQKLGVLSNNCFVAGTQVMTGDPTLGSISGVNIEDIRVDDLVWSRDEHDPDAALELKPVTAVFQSVAYDLQSVSLRSADGNVEQIEATDEHPFYVEGRGWTAAVDLLPGDRVLSNGSDISSVLVVAANADLKRPDGVAVFNFAVEGNHTYFVDDEVGNGWAWVHNTCVSINGPKGIAAQAQTVTDLRRNGFKVVSERLYVRTPLGLREIDVVLERAGKLYGLEVKSGNAVRTLSQLAKDNWINQHGATFTGRKFAKLKKQGLVATDVLDSIMVIQVP